MLATHQVTFVILAKTSITLSFSSLSLITQIYFTYDISNSVNVTFDPVDHAYNL